MEMSHPPEPMWDEPQKPVKDPEYKEATLQEQREAAESNYSTMRAAVSWHLGGADWATIAQRFGYSSPQAARVAVEKFEGDLVGSSDITAARNKALARYERMLNSVWPDAVMPFLAEADGRPGKDRNEAHGAALDRARALVGDMVRLQGLAAPTQLQVYMPGADEMLEVVAALRSAKLSEIAQEADIFDAEEVDDTEKGERDAG